MHELPVTFRIALDFQRAGRDPSASPLVLPSHPWHQSEWPSCNVPFETLLRHALAPEQMTVGEREAMLEHLRLCITCSEAYTQIAQAEMDDLAEVQGELAMDTSHIPVDQGLADLWRRIDAYEAEQANAMASVHVSYHCMAYVHRLHKCPHNWPYCGDTGMSLFECMGW